MASYWISIAVIVVAIAIVVWTMYKNRLFFHNLAAMASICVLVIANTGAGFFIILHHDESLLLPFSCFLLLNAVFVSVLMKETKNKKLLTFKGDASLEGVIAKLQSNKKSALMEAQLRVGEVLWHDKLIKTINEISAKLFGSSVNSFNDDLYECMGKLGVTFEVDRVYIWQNFTKDDGLYCGQLHEWSGGAEPQQGNEYTTLIPFPMAWFPNLSNNKCVNSLVKDFPKRERELLSAQDIVSIVVVPIFINGIFWGFVGFDDCHHERVFTKEEEEILKSVSLLFTNSYLRYELDRKLLAAKNDAQKSDESKTNFLATISHEIRTPINAITGMSKIARSSTDRTKILDCLDSIDVASRQLLSIINDILDMSKIEVGKFELVKRPFDLLAAIHNVQNIMSVQAVEKSLTFDLIVDSDVPKYISNDDTRLSQVLINLLSNAIKFTSKGGKIGLSVKMIKKENNPDSLEFSVYDTGIGITSSSKDKLFNKFEQVDNSKAREYGGTGLGLSICKSIVDLMNGHISVDSTFGKGSVFTVTIPAKATEMPKPPQEEDKIKATRLDLTGKNILLVEDIEINREIIVTLLNSANINVDEAENGVVALEMIKMYPTKYDAILMDVHMPLKDGFETTREIRSLDIPSMRGIPIIAVTANAFDDDVKKSLDAGMNDHIAKPVNFDILLDKLSTLIKLREESFAS